MHAKVNGNISFWYADLGGVPPYRAPLPGDRSADVCVVGGGFTGLWTSYYLKKANPGLNIVIVEKEFAGFGASGRNGGWLSGGFGWSREKYLETSSRGAVIDMEAAMHGTVNEVIGVAEKEGIDADIRRNDTLTVAANKAQLARIKQSYEDELGWGVPKERVSLIGRDEMRARIDIDKVQGALVHHGSARVQPAKLVRGLAAVVERMGVPIYEQTEVTRIEKGAVTTKHGTVKAPIIVRATEGFTAGIPGFERLWIPVNSAILMSEPLSEEQWAKIGWNGYELLGDASHAYCYAQRTREGRIAMGGRGVPYRYGSATDIRGQTQQETIDKLHAILMRLLPQTRGLKMDHAWCGVLGVPRDWCTTVGLDRKSGIAWAGGYVGLGVSSSNLSGRTLADLILERDTPLTRLPWVNRSVREWEPEPLRWLGVHSMYHLYHMADRREEAGLEHTSHLATIANKITGR